jgi:hypothetical protein
MVQAIPSAPLFCIPVAAKNFALSQAVLYRTGCISEFEDWKANAS